MADETDESRQEPNLELPSLLGFRRKKRGRKGDTGADDTTAEVPAAEEPTTMVPPTEPPEVVATPDAEEVVEETRPIVATPPRRPSPRRQSQPVLSRHRHRLPRPSRRRLSLADPPA